MLLLSGRPKSCHVPTKAPTIGCQVAALVIVPEMSVVPWADRTAAKTSTPSIVSGFFNEPSFQGREVA